MKKRQILLIVAPLALVILLAFMYSSADVETAVLVAAADLNLDLVVGDVGHISCTDGELVFVGLSISQTEASCNIIPTPTLTPTLTPALAPSPTFTPTSTPTPPPMPSPTPSPTSGELLANWQLYNTVDGQGNLACDPQSLTTAPNWEANYWVFRGPWNEDPDPDGCVTRTMGEAYPDNSMQANHIPSGETGTLWQVAAAPTPYSRITLGSVYGQHESGTIAWSLWDCPKEAAAVSECSLIYRTDSTTMRIPFLNTKECSAYQMTLEVETTGNVTWSAEKVLASCPGDPVTPVLDTTAVFSSTAYIGVLHEITPRTDGIGMSGVKIGNITLFVSVQ